MATQVERQDGLGPTMIWLAAMFVGLGVVAYFMV